ncbi:MAG: hypothetical protein EBS73_12235 [Betaproteobacteria bacterium]|nr:hypothetical protein [Betaproteobacteria bacterium]NBS40017.1 hypothetical protein [Betaproteobacteria bacterium]NDC03763.1 hypothetical protein [Betaproteobacteria bacterium]NDC86451.1 hypothetical protein [Betaproteobacteria bacterium]NDE46843.1 hypothetical protein [Betaproteobacteria bacterium]
MLRYTLHLVSMIIQCWLPRCAQAVVFFNHANKPNLLPCRLHQLKRLKKQVLWLIGVVSQCMARIVLCEKLSQYRHLPHFFFINHGLKGLL